MMRTDCYQVIRSCVQSDVYTGIYTWKYAQELIEKGRHITASGDKERLASLRQRWSRAREIAPNDKHLACTQGGD